jgi:hypothetical protein
MIQKNKLLLNETYYKYSLGIATMLMMLAIAMQWEYIIGGTVIFVFGSMGLAE